MRKLLFAFALVLFAGAPASAQTSFGAGLVYTDLDPLSLGLQVNAYFPLPAVPEMRIGGAFTYFLPEEQSVSIGGDTYESEIELWELNGNAQYHLVSQPTVSVYGLGGLNISRVSGSFSLGEFGSASGSDTKVGVNLGAGAAIPVNFGSVYGEAKYVVASDEMGRFVLGAGVRIAP